MTREQAIDEAVRRVGRKRDVSDLLGRHGPCPACKMVAGEIRDEFRRIMAAAE